MEGTLLVTGTSESVVREKVSRFMPVLDFINKFDKSTMTDSEVVSVTAIYKDKNEIIGFWF